MSRNITPIGIAVVEHDDQFLVGVRPEDVPLAGYAEFPGGKCEPHESPEACAVRECHEEAGIIVEPTRLIERLMWDYPHGRVDLHFWHCTPTDDDPLRAPFRWISRRELTTLQFPDANARVIEFLTAATPR